MTPQSFFRVCAELEQSVGDLYRRFADHLASYPAAAELFLELADQEDIHAKAMQLMARLMRGVKDTTAVKGGAARVARTMGDGLTRAKAMVENGRNVTVEAALLTAIRIESCAFEVHSPNFVETDSEELRSTVRMLTTETDIHKAKLEKLLEELKEKGRNVLPP